MMDPRRDSMESEGLAPDASGGDLPEAAQPVALRVRSLAKRYEDTVAVEELSFEVRRGEILGLVGPNGAGKTTTLRSIAGVLPLQQGTVEVGGFDLAKEEVEAKRRLAWVPDDPQPFDTLTVREHVQFTAQLYGISDWEDEGERLLERFELAEKRDALGGELFEELADSLLIIHRGRRVFGGSLDEARALHAEGGDATLERIFMTVTGEGEPPPPEDAGS